MGNFCSTTRNRKTFCAAKLKFFGNEVSAAESQTSGENGGGRGIRTPDTLSGIAVFKTAGINRSPIPPRMVSTV
jgi:hypothetical protein